MKPMPCPQQLPTSGPTTTGTSGFAQKDAVALRRHEVAYLLPETQPRLLLPEDLLGIWLVVDDAELNRAVIGTILEAFGAVVEYAGDGIEALAALGRKKYVAMIIDGNMPNLDGYETIERIRRYEVNDDLNRLPILLWTGKPEDPRIARAEHDVILIKPIRNPEELLKACAQLKVFTKTSSILDVAPDKNCRRKVDGKEHKEMPLLQIKFNASERFTWED